MATFEGYPTRVQAGYQDPSMDSQEFQAVTNIGGASRPSGSGYSPAAGYGSVAPTYQQQQYQQQYQEQYQQQYQQQYSSKQGRASSSSSYSSSFSSQPPSPHQQGAYRGPYPDQRAAQNQAPTSGRPRSPDLPPPGQRPVAVNEASEAYTDDGFDDGWHGELEFHGKPMTSRDSDDSFSSPMRTVRKPGQQLGNTMEARLKARVDEAMGRHLSGWDVADVSNWIQIIGFPQYRRKFVHNSVDGNVLQSLTEEHLRRDFGVGPVGHRQAILGAIAELKQHSNAMGQDASTMAKGRRPIEHPRRPASASPHVIPPAAHLGPAQGKVTVEEQKRKLQYSLDRTLNKAAQGGALLKQLAHTKSLTDQETRRLRGQLMAVKAQHDKLERRSGPMAGQEADIPWIPPHGRVPESHPERFAAPGEDPMLDHVFIPKKTQAHKIADKEIRQLVGEVYRRPKLFDSLTGAYDRIRKIKEDIDAMEKGGDQTMPMAADDVQVQAPPSKKQTATHDWVPPGPHLLHGLKEVKIKVSEEARQAERLTADINFLEKMFKKWNYPEAVREKGASKIGRQAYPQLLRALDDLIDAIVLPVDFGADNGIRTFQTSVKQFFRERNMNLEPAKDKDDTRKPEEVVATDRLLHKIAKLKGCEKLTELDTLKLKLREAKNPDAHKKADEKLDKMVIKKRTNHKVHSLAGLAHMAEVVGRRYGFSKKGDADGNQADDAGDDDDKQGKNKNTATKRRVNKKEGKYGPFVPNGILHRPDAVPLSDLLAPRVSAYRKKIGLNKATIEAGHPGKEKAKEAEFNKDLEKAEGLFRVLGWHHATERSIAQNLSKGKVEDLINSLLRRALYIATLKENQLLLFKEAKQYKADMLAEFRLLLSRMNPRHPNYKAIELRIAELKGLEVKMDPLPEVDWSAEQFQYDGLRLLQDCELQIRREHAADDLQRMGAQRQRQSMTKSQVLTQRGRPGVDQANTVTRAEIEDLVSQWDYLDCCVEQLGCLSTQDLRRMLRLIPSGEQEQQVNEDAPLGLHQLQLHDDGVRGDKDEDAKARAALIAYNKAIKTKKVALYRAVAMRQFVESYDAQMKDRERRMNDLIHQLGQEHAQHKKLLTKDQQDEFFGRLLKDVHARREALEQLRMRKIQEELATMTPFRARPFSPGRKPRPVSPRRARHQHRQVSPHVQPPGTGPGARSPGAVRPAGGPTGQQPYTPRQGGFKYWDGPELGASGRPGSAPGGPQPGATRPTRRPDAHATRGLGHASPRGTDDESVSSGGTLSRYQRPAWDAMPGSTEMMLDRHGPHVRGHHVGASAGRGGHGSQRQPSSRPAAQRGIMGSDSDSSHVHTPGGVSRSPSPLGVRLGAEVSQGVSGRSGTATPPSLQGLPSPLPGAATPLSSEQNTPRSEVGSAAGMGGYTGYYNAAVYQGGSATPSGSATPAGSMTPGGSVTPAGGVTPSGSVTPAGSVTPGGGATPRDSVPPDTPRSVTSG